MPELNTILSSINESADSIKTLYFRPPGIFTNALVLKPDITTLLRDADAHESSLYSVDKTGIPERKDGTRGVVDALNYEFDQLELQQLNPTVDNDDDIRPAVLFVPRDADNASLPEISKGVKNLLSRFNEENLSEYEFEALCGTVRQLLEKYPIEEMEEELRGYEMNYKTLTEEILQSEQKLEKQKTLLSQLNSTVTDRRLSADNQRNLTKAHAQKISAADLIEQEEAEIRRLELELSVKNHDLS